MSSVTRREGGGLSLLHSFSCPTSPLSLLSYSSLATIPLILLFSYSFYPFPSFLIFHSSRLPLEDAKRLVLKNLRILEVVGYIRTCFYFSYSCLSDKISYSCSPPSQVAGYTSSKDGCQSIISDMARDILNQREHRLEDGLPLLLSAPPG